MYERNPRNVLCSCKKNSPLGGKGCLSVSKVVLPCLLSSEWWNRVRLFLDAISLNKCIITNKESKDNSLKLQVCILLIIDLYLRLQII